MEALERLKELRRHVDRQQGKREVLVDQIRVEEEALANYEHEAEELTKATEVLQAAAEARRQELKDRVESLVTSGLRGVFGRDDYEFLFRVNLAANRFGIDPVLRSMFGEKELEADILENHGGGLADVTGFLLRVIVLCLARPKVAPVMFLDEIFSQVSPEFIRECAVLLRELNTTANVQFVMVTHRPELLDAADVVYRARLENGQTKFTLEHDMKDAAYHQRPAPGQKGRDRASVFDGEDLTKDKASEVEVRHGETTDVLAIRQRKQAELREPEKKKRASIKNRRAYRTAQQARRRARRKAEREGHQ